MDAPIDPGLTAELEQIRIERFITHLNKAAPEQRDALLQRLCTAAGTSISRVARTLIDSITAERWAVFLEPPA
ncbi:MAG: hypothetical protein IID40_10170 [Planctomycetes bacterium]|nr:hypothetical protein [Planctomycetota bacterium]